MEQAKTFSLEDLDETKASSEAFEFEYINPQGDGTGIFLQVLGRQSETVTREVARLINDRRHKEAVREMNKKGGKAATFEPLESDIEFGQRLAAVRLVGWKGIREPWTPENSLKLCRTNIHIAGQVTEQSDNMGNFMKG